MTLLLRRLGKAGMFQQLVPAAVGFNSNSSCSLQQSRAAGSHAANTNAFILEVIPRMPPRLSKGPARQLPCQHPPPPGGRELWCSPNLLAHCLPTAGPATPGEAWTPLSLA